MSIHLGTAYIAGPMRDYESFNFPAFREAAGRLRSVGWTVLSPAERDLNMGFDPSLNSLDGFDVEAALADDFGMILRADAIVMLSGWQGSKGARAERFVAEQVGKRVLVMDATRLDWTAPAPPWDGNPHLPSTHTTETRVTDPDTGGQKGTKLARFDLLPARALWQVAELYGRGAEKYADRNWELGYAWHLSFAAMMRHAWLFWGGEDVDAETQCPHLASVVFHALALMTFAETETGTDDRPR